LIGLGFVDTINDVRAMIQQVDEDQSGEIEFNEFLSILKSSEGGERTRAIKKFFEGLTKQEYGKIDLPFSNYVLEQRRHSLIDAIKSEDQAKRDHGKRIL
jgi:Ca2+-binding EF-hand superfamily protein